MDTPYQVVAIEAWPGGRVEPLGPGESGFDMWDYLEYAKSQGWKDDNQSKTWGAVVEDARHFLAEAKAVLDDHHRVGRSRSSSTGDPE